MNAPDPRRMLYSIGYAGHTMERFIRTLMNYSITAVADVRSQPYSRFRAEFNRENLRKNLTDMGIAYVFLGDNLGARIDAPECYVDGIADYDRIARHPKFRQGLDRIKHGMKRYRIALMCAEKDPITCHRSILVFRNLRGSGIALSHILGDGTLEDHGESEKRLLKLMKLDQLDIFSDNSKIFERAYEKQARNIAYRTDHPDQPSEVYH